MLRVFLEGEEADSPQLGEDPRQTNRGLAGQVLGLVDRSQGGADLDQELEPALDIGQGRLFAERRLDRLGVEGAGVLFEGGSVTALLVHEVAEAGVLEVASAGAELDDVQREPRGRHEAVRDHLNVFGGDLA